MSKSSSLYRKAAESAQAAESALQRKAATSPLYRKAADLGRKHSRRSVIAASVAAASVLGAAGFAVGAAPWAQAVSNAATTAQGGPSASSGQLDDSFFQALSGGKAHDGKPLAAGQLDTIRSAKAVGRAGVNSAGQAAEIAPKQQTAHAAQPKAATRKAAAKRKAAAQPYRIYDSVKPETLPSGKPAAVYVNGAYAAFPKQLGGRNSVLWIDTNGSDPAANVLDVEPGDATPAGAARWVKQRLNSQPHAVAIVYTMRSEWQQVKDRVADLPSWMQSKVKYWIADPTGVDHVVPGASATQWYWGHNYDVTTANPDFGS